MFDFFFYSRDQLLFLFLIALTAFIIEAGYIAAILFNNLIRKRLDIVAEVTLLLYCSLIVILPITAMTNKQYDFVDLSFVTTLFCITGSISIIISSYLIYLRRYRFIPHLFTVLLTMPVLNSLPFNIYLILYVIASTSIGVRGLKLLFEEMFLQKNELSAFSIKEGLDSLPAGVVFFDSDGYIYLMNRIFRKFLNSIEIKSYHNGNDIWTDLKNGNTTTFESLDVEGDILIRTSRKAYRFSKHKFISEGTVFFEIIALDVTETVTALYALEEDNVKLLSQRDEIEELSQKILELRRMFEYSKIRTQVHDIMSQRLSALSRILQSRNKQDPADILPIIEDILIQIRSKENKNSTQLKKELLDFFGRVGLSINITGAKIDDEDISFLFFSVLREACTNAIRHAQATLVNAKIEKNDSEYRIEITNDGEHPKSSIVEGSGLRGISSRVDNIGGKVRFEIIPEFAIVITIPIENSSKSTQMC